MEWTDGMILMIISALFSAISIFYCNGSLGPGIKPAQKCKVDGFLLLGIISDCVAGFGFWFLTSGPPNPCTDYSLTLTMLSLLSAGVITGNFVFSYSYEDRRSCLANLTAFCLEILFLLLFGSLSFYMGKSAELSEAEGIKILGPIIMSLIMLSCTLFDAWESSERTESS